MAGMKSIDDARSSLEDAVLMMNSTLEMVDDVCVKMSGGEVPSWVFVMGAQARLVRDQAEAYMQAVHKYARPLLSDMEALTHPKAGLGGKPREAGEAAGSRGTGTVPGN